MQELAASIGQLTDAKEKMDRQLAESRQRNEHLEQLGNEARDKLLEKVEEINRLTSQSQLNEERISSIQRDRVRLEEEISQLNEKLVRELENGQKLEEQKAEVEAQLTGAEQLLTEKIDAYNRVLAEANGFSDAVEQGKNQIFQLHNQVSEKKSEARTYENYKDTLEKRRKQLHQDQEEMERNAAAYENLMAEAQREKAEADELLETLRSSLEEARADRVEYDDEIQVL